MLYHTELNNKPYENIKKKNPLPFKGVEDLEMVCIIGLEFSLFQVMGDTDAESSRKDEEGESEDA